MKKQRQSVRSWELALGIVIPAILFVSYLGVNIWPVIAAVAAITALLLFVNRRGQAGLARSSGRAKQGNNQISEMSFDRIGGQDRAKNELIEALDFLVRPDDIRKFGIRPMKGILLTGPPGTGKTLMAKASAHYADAIFIGVSGSEFVEMYVGVGAGRVRELFKEARQRAEKEKKQK